MSDAVMVPRAWLLKVVDTLKPFAEVAEKLRHCHVVEICELHPDNPSPNIAVMPREWLERAGDDLETAVIVLHRDGALSEGQAAKLTGLDRVEVRKLSDALAASTPVEGWEEPDEQDVLDTISDAIGDGMDLDWTYSIGAKAIVEAFKREGWTVSAPPPPSVSIDNGSRPQEAVPTEGHGTSVVDWQARHIVFDGPPSHDGPRFVEVETPEGKSVNAGEWRERPDGYWELVILAPAENLIGAAEKEVGQAVYERIETLIGGNSAELDYLAELVSSVEEYGSYSGPTKPLSPQPADGCSSNEGAGK